MQEFILKIRMVLNNIFKKKLYFFFYFSEFCYVSCIVNKKLVEFKCKIRIEYKLFQFLKVKLKMCVMIIVLIYFFKKNYFYWSFFVQNYD